MMLQNVLMSKFQISFECTSFHYLVTWASLDYQIISKPCCVVDQGILSFDLICQLVVRLFLFFFVLSIRTFCISAKLHLSTRRLLFLQPENGIPPISVSSTTDATGTGGDSSRPISLPETGRSTAAAQGCQLYAGISKHNALNNTTISKFLVCRGKDVFARHALRHLATLTQLLLPIARVRHLEVTFGNKKLANLLENMSLISVFLFIPK
jgi:hypothetical protein